MSSTTTDKNLYDVVIIGAGLSGLAAAYEILGKDKSVSVKILEANSRVGGRALSDADGTDLGAGYIGPTQDRIMRIVDECGLELYKVNTEGETCQYIRGVSSRFEGTIPPISALGLLDVNAALCYIDKMASTVDAEAPHRTPNAEELDRITLAEMTRRQCFTQDAASMIRTACQTLLCVEPTEVSVLAFCWYVAQSGNIKRIIETKDGAQDSKVVGGTGNIAVELAKKLPREWMQLNSPVRHIDWSSSDKVAVSVMNYGSKNNNSETPTTFAAKTLIMAIPPVQQIKIDFSPTLSANRFSALQHFPMGHVMKTFTFYEKPWWKDHGLNGSSVSDHGISVVAFDDSKPDGSYHCIMGFVLSDAAAKWGFGKTPEDRKNALCQHFAKVYNCKEALTPCNYKEKNWADEPFVGGCYVAVPTPGTLTKYLHEARKCQISDNVFVAGTETALKMVGYMDGAVEAGERSARNALVRLGKLPQDQFQVVSEPEPSPQMPFVEMSITAEEKMVPSVPQALAIFGVVVAGLGALAMKFF